MGGNIIERDAVTRSAPISRRLVMDRRIWLSIHKYVGLFLGLVFVVVGLTGSILAFWQTIDETLNKELMIVTVPDENSSYRSLDEILASANAMAPPHGLPTVLTMPRHKNAAVSVSYTVATQEREPDQYEVFVDPYTAKPTGRRFLQHADSVRSMPFVRTIISLHASLLTGDDNRFVVGIPAIFLLISVSAGLYLWWPRNGNWRHAFTVKWGATPVRFVYDLHKTTGLYLLAVLAFLLFSGIYIIFKPQVSSLVALFSTVREEPKDLKSKPPAGRPPLTLSAVAIIADNTLRDGELHWIYLPQGREGVYGVGKQLEYEPNRWATYRNVTIDQYSGEILYVQDRANFAAGERFLEWLYPLHCGEAFGNYGRAFIMVMGFVPLVLYVTGFIRWRQKGRARS